MILRVVTFLIVATIVSYGKTGVERFEHAGVVYQVIRAQPQQVRIVWKDNNGVPLRQLSAVATFLKARGETTIAVMNGGIFEPGGVPTGLLIQDGKTLQPINHRDEKGNFYLKPNGVFFIAGDKAGVVDAAGDPLGKQKVSYAVQSGPLLLKNGKTHPAFNKESSSRLVRNGVGVTNKGVVILAMTDFDSPRFPNLYEFAELFRTLDCANALFLDGDLCELRSGANIENPSNSFGAIIAVVEAVP